MKNPESNNKFHLIFWLVLIAGSTFIYSEQTTEPFLASRSIFLAVGIFFYILGFYFLKKTPFFQLKSNTTKAFFGGLIAFGSLAAITSFFGAHSVEAYFPLSKFFLFSTTTVLIFQFLKNENSLLPFFKFFTILTLIHALLGIYQFSFVDIGLPSDSQMSWLMGHRNLWGSFLAGGVFFSLYFALYGKGVWKILGLISMSAGIGGVLISQSRSAWLALLGGAVIWGVFSYLKKDEVSKGIDFRLSGAVLGSIVTAVGLSAVLLLSTPASRESLAHRWNTLIAFQTDGNEAEAATGSIVFRIRTWKQSIDMFREHPLFGVGSGSWKIHIPRYGNGSYEESTGAIIRHSAHNEYVQIACETGFIGFVIFLILILAVSRSIFKISTKESLLFLAPVCALSALAVDMFFSFPLDRIEHLLLMAFCLAVIFHLSEKEKEGGFLNQKNLLLGTLLVGSVAAGFVSVQRFSFEKYMKIATQTFYAGDYSTSIKNAELAVNPFCGIERAGDPPELFSGMAKHISGQPVEAMKDFEIGLKKHPNSARIYNALGSLFSTEKRYEEAVETLEKALIFAPNHKVVKKNLMVNYFRTERYQKCIDIAQTMHIQDDKRLYSMYMKAFELRALKAKLKKNE